MMNDRKQLRRIAGSLEALAPTSSQRGTHLEPMKSKLPLVARFVLYLGASDKKAARARAIRRSFTIRGYVGPNGGGKSLCLVNDCLPDLDRGRTVLSTVRLIDSRTGEDHKSFVWFHDFDQLLSISKATILMDEVTGIANSRSGASLSQRVQNNLVQLRRRDLSMGWSAPNFARADVIVREVTQAITECRGMFPDAAEIQDGDIKLWAPRRVFRFKTYDTVEFEDWTAGKRDKLDPIASEWFRGPGSRAFKSYNTLDSVSLVSHASEAGLCPICEKKVKAGYCGGHTDALGHEHDSQLAEAIDSVDRARFVGDRLVALLSDGTVVV